jgi:hypothetical protein
VPGHLQSWGINRPSRRLLGRNPPRPPPAVGLDGALADPLSPGDSSRRAFKTSRLAEMSVRTKSIEERNGRSLVKYQRPGRDSDGMFKFLLVRPMIREARSRVGGARCTAVSRKA